MSRAVLVESLRAWMKHQLVQSQSPSPDRTNASAPEPRQTSKTETSASPSAPGATSFLAPLEAQKYASNASGNTSGCPALRSEHNSSAYITTVSAGNIAYEY